MSQPTKETFINDVKNHKLTIVKDDGVYRHIIMQEPGTSNLMYEIITYPGGLTYTGDMGTFVFSRVEDMFRFFRRDDLSINYGYWSEKCLSGKTYEYSDDEVVEYVKEEFKEYKERAWENEAFDEEEDKEEIEEFNTKMEEIYDDIEYNVLNKDNVLSAIQDYYDSYKTEMFYEIPYNCFDVPTYRGIWALYAIVHAISEYDKTKG